MRRAVVGLVAGLAVAGGAPAAWAVARPPSSAGVPVTQALGSPVGDVLLRPVLAPQPPAGVLPPVTVRDAAPAAVPDPAAAPVAVSVPGSGVTAAVDPVGVTGDGLMELPADVDRVGWYRFGPVPGQPGSAVLAGHVDGVEQGLGPLAALRSVEPGQTVEVTDAAGTVTRWRVVSRELVEKQALPLAALFARNGDPRLVLLTCGGPFLPELGSYRDNVVVVAVPA
ncbi:class F sortase [Modestobacter sp. I12A-02662]|uniref:class F sortase n=1 Tax=Modestobacter sp. I12A-02662 TaxID=1730496 RepID=UPI0034DE5D3A